MSGPWCEDDGDQYSVGGVMVPRPKPRFSFTEVKLLLEAVKRNRNIILKKFNYRVPPEAKKRAWAEITEQINDLGENHREVRQIMKKWADLKCDGQRRIAALRGPNGSNLRKKCLGPVEKMVHKILMMSPEGDGDSDLDFGEEEIDFTKLHNRQPQEGPAASPFSYLSMTDSSLALPGGGFECSPLSSPDKDLSGEPIHSSPDFDLDMGDDGDAMDFDDDDDSYQSSLAPPSSVPLDPLPNDSLLRSKPVHTYSRNHHSQNHASSTRPPPRPNSSSLPAVVDSSAASSSVTPPQSDSPSHANITASSLSAPPSSSIPPLPASPSSSTSFAANDCSSQPTLSSSSLPPPPAPLPPPPHANAISSSSVTTPAASRLSSSLPPPPQPTASSSSSQQAAPSSSSSSVLPADRPSHSGSTLSDTLPAGASSRRVQDYVAQLATQSLQQQRASRMLLASVSRSLETLAQSVQLLVESQHEFVQESLMLQKETVDILRDFSNTALVMLRDKSNNGQVAAQHPASHF
ncbi:hypothetical protein LDENG_00082280 [Lucifuga dentata]|nr:hypothetical protein LDENG_00082280 [Lucifuga dentata]